MSSEPAKPKIAAQTVPADDANMRLDRWLKNQFPAVTQGQIHKFLRTGQIRVDGKRAEASTRLKEGQSLRLPPQLYGEALPAKREANKKRDADKLRDLIIYQDDDVVALNKPAGLAVQGGTGLKENIDDALMALSRDGKTKPKLVHRLDRDTSGILLVARTDYAARQLTAAFRDRATRKIYWAMTLGVPKPEQGRIATGLIKRGETMHVVEPGDEGKEENEDAKGAITLYQVMESVKRQAAFVALWPITGRTHQLRVHLQYLGTPIFGDRMYGGTVAENLPQEGLGSGLHLHARRLIVPHPRRGYIDVTAPLGKEMKKSWKWFNFDASTEFDFEGA